MSSSAAARSPWLGRLHEAHVGQDRRRGGRRRWPGLRPGPGGRGGDAPASPSPPPVPSAAGPPGDLTHGFRETLAFTALSPDGEPVEIDLRPGGLLVFDHGVHGVIPARVETVEPPRVLSWRCPQGAAGEEPDDSNATLVEFTLTRDDSTGGSRLTLVESGFARLGLPADEAADRLRACPRCERCSAIRSWSYSTRSVASTTTAPSSSSGTGALHTTDRANDSSRARTAALSPPARKCLSGMASSTRRPARRNSASRALPARPRSSWSALEPRPGRGRRSAGRARRCGGYPTAGGPGGVRGPGRGRGPGRHCRRSCTRLLRPAAGRTTIIAGHPPAATLWIIATVHRCLTPHAIPPKAPAGATPTEARTNSSCRAGSRRFRG